MRERRVIGVVILLAILVSVSLVFGLGIVDITKLASTPAPPLTSGSTTVFVDPDLIVKDYDLDAGYQIGDTFSWDIDVSDVSDLYAYQINITWNPDILNFTGISYGDFLSQTTSPDGTSSIYDIFDASNETGYAVIAESILGDVSGIPGPDSGGLVTIGFEIVGYGWTELTVGLSGTLPSTLLDSTGGTLTFDRVLVPILPSDGYFRNTLRGDVTDDSLVGVGPPDGDVDSYDLGIFADNYGRSTTLP